MSRIETRHKDCPKTTLRTSNGKTYGSVNWNLNSPDTFAAFKRRRTNEICMLFIPTDLTSQSGNQLLKLITRGKRTRNLFPVARRIIARFGKKQSSKKQMIILMINFSRGRLSCHTSFCFLNCTNYVYTFNYQKWPFNQRLPWQERYFEILNYFSNILASEGREKRLLFTAALIILKTLPESVFLS